MADIQTLVNAIPDANDGGIISSDYHNTIKAALLAIASQLAGAGGTSGTLTLQPNFISLSTPPWNVNIGVASDPGPPGADGFLPVSLPDGAVIQSMTATGTRTGNNRGSVTLLVIPISGGSGGTTLIQIDLSVAGNPFTLTGLPNPTQSKLTAAALQQMLLIQNSQFKYVIEATAEVLPDNPAGTLQINAVQIAYTTGS
jgi:hypothetical protein